MKKKEMLSKIEQLESKIEQLEDDIENLYKLNNKLIRDMEKAQDELNYLLNPDKSCRLHLKSEFNFDTNKYETYIYVDYFNYNTLREINDVKVSCLYHIGGLDPIVLKDLEKEILKQFSVKENKKYISIYYKTERVCYIITKENCQVSTVTLDVANYLLSKEN